MIAYIQGKILEKGLTYLIVENQGLGYKVFATPDALVKPVGSEIALFTHHKSSEDGQALFGLADFSSLQFFEMLKTSPPDAPEKLLLLKIIVIGCCSDSSSVPVDSGK